MLQCDEYKNIPMKLNFLFFSLTDHKRERERNNKQTTEWKQSTILMFKLKKVYHGFYNKFTNNTLHISYTYLLRVKDISELTFDYW